MKKQKKNCQEEKLSVTPDLTVSGESETGVNVSFGVNFGWTFDLPVVKKVKKSQEVKTDKSPTR